MQETLKVTFWGVRGSYPVAGSHVARTGGNTPCVAVQAGSQVIILDAGTGIIGLGKELMEVSQPLQAAIFFSHYHHDHTQGLPFFTPAFLPHNNFNLFGPDLQEQQLEDVLRAMITPPVFPVRLSEMKARLNFHDLAGSTTVWLMGTEEVRIFAPGTCPPASERPANVVEVRLLTSYAHPGGVMLYRINWRSQSIVYASDTEGYVGSDRRLSAFARDADILIHDSQYTEEHYCGLQSGLPATQGWGHSTIQMACALAAASNVRQLVLFHHDPGYDDDRISANETLARSLFARSLAAREGLQLETGNVDNYPYEASGVQYRYRKQHGHPPAAPFITGSS